VLSEREQQALREIEQAISADDPGLASALRRSRMSTSAWWMRLAHDAVAAVAVVLAVLCVALGEVGPGFAAGLFAAVVIALRRRRFPPRASRRPWLKRRA
jgi:uncharacterized membrane protein